MPANASGPKPGASTNFATLRNALPTCAQTAWRAGRGDRMAGPFRAPANGAVASCANSNPSGHEVRRAAPAGAAVLASAARVSTNTKNFPSLRSWYRPDCAAPFARSTAAPESLRHRPRGRCAGAGTSWRPCRGDRPPSPGGRTNSRTAARLRAGRPRHRLFHHP